MRIPALLSLAASAFLALTGAVVGQQSTLVPTAKSLVPFLEAETGRLIAVLERSDTDLEEFYYRATQALCEKTGDNWCEENLITVLTDTTNPLGWSRILNYTGDDGSQKTVCAMLPPRPNVDSGYAATGLSGGRIITMRDLPTDAEMEAYLWLEHIASCNWVSGSEQEQAQSTVFAVMALSLIQGDPQFAGNYDITPARRFVPFRHSDEARWGVNVGERLLLEHWKRQAGELLAQIPCAVTVTPSTDLNTDYITRASSLGNQNCTTNDGETSRTGVVRDENLWLWMNSDLLSTPPRSYTPFAMFPTTQSAVHYIWTTAKRLSQ